jgi:multicomponent Na+:H+ antiporter subunit F
MHDWHLLTALALLISVAVGLLRLLASRDPVERLLVLQLLGTTVVAVVLLLAQGLGRPGLRDLALVFGLLAATVAVAFARYGRLHAERDGREP